MPVSLMELLIELLAIRLSAIKHALKSLVIAIRLSCKNPQPSRWLSRGAWLLPIYRLYNHGLPLAGARARGAKTPSPQSSDGTTSHSTRRQGRQVAGYPAVRGCCRFIGFTATAYPLRVRGRGGEREEQLPISGSLREFHVNGHGKCANPDDETCHARFPLSSSLGETTSHSTKLQKSAAKSLVIPQCVVVADLSALQPRPTPCGCAGERGKGSLREFHVKGNQ